MSNWQLDMLTVKELRELRDRVDDAIRVAIARQRAERESGRFTGEAMATTIDLEKERDAWTASRKRM